MKKIAHILPYGAALLPGFAFAQGEVDTSWITDFIETVIELIQAAIPLLIAIAVLYFIWGVVQFIINAGDEGARAEGKTKMIWGVVGLFIIISVWGLVALLQSIFTFGDDTAEIRNPIDEVLDL